MIDLLEEAADEDEDGLDGGGGEIAVEESEGEGGDCAPTPFLPWEVEKRVVGQAGRGGEGGGGGIIAPLEGACDEDEGVEGVGLVVGWCWVGLPVARCWLVANGLFFV
jgi:hypothetical protein